LQKDFELNQKTEKKIKKIGKTKRAAGDRFGSASDRAHGPFTFIAEAIRRERPPLH
jgi:hypothetical protein